MIMSHALEAARFAIKLYARSDEHAFEQEPFIGVFQRWIQQDKLEGELTIDAVDYRHVPDGPGVMLICHAAHYSLDATDGRLGLLYANKRDAPEGDFRQRLKAALTRALQAASLLRAEPAPGRMDFVTDHWRFIAQDRLMAPNTSETFATLRPELERVAVALYPAGKITVELGDEDARSCFSAAIHLTEGEQPEVNTLLERARQL